MKVIESVLGIIGFAAFVALGLMTTPAEDIAAARSLPAWFYMVTIPGALLGGVVITFLVFAFLAVVTNREGRADEARAMGEEGVGTRMDDLVKRGN